MFKTNIRKEDEKDDCRGKKFQVHSFRTCYTEREREKSSVEVEDSVLCLLLHTIFCVSYSDETVRGQVDYKTFPHLIFSP